MLRSMADAVNGRQPLEEHEFKALVEKLLPWNEEIQARFLADDPFKCRPYTTDSKAVW